MRLRALAGLVVMLFLTGPAAAVPDGERSGGWRLADAVSPYLRMHADNAVAWRPWGEAAFQAARDQNKPLFISIGYFTCHWCHVMAEESFQDRAIARVVNRHFIPVKVDREQHPAIDAAYLRFVEATAGTGGWPLNVFTTPDGLPFFGGTYFPPEPKKGEPGFRQLVERWAEAWRTEEDRLRRKAQRHARGFQRAGAVDPVSSLPPGLADRGARALADEADPFHGGFGTSQKFPRASDLLFLLSRTSDEEAGMALDALDAMAAGALFDQLGGGFHRYATDPQWRLPHFEKMLYTQAMLGRAYLAAFERTGQSRHARVARRTLEFALTDMRHPQGGFFAALAASSPLPGEPEASTAGAYYTWTREAFTEALGTGKLRELAAARYGVAPGGNTGEAALGRRNVLYRAAAVADLAQAFNLDRTEVRQRLAEARRRLARHRRSRPPPEVDRKVVAAWNGAMITTLVRAARVLQEPYYKRAARRTAAFVWRQLVVDGQGPVRIRRSWTDGRPGPEGTATDYAALAEAALALHRATGEAVWRQRARGLLEALRADFRDPEGGLYARAEGRLWLRPKPVDDNPEPSANSLAVRAMVALGRQGGGERWLEAARRAAAWQAARVGDSPDTASYLLAAWPHLLSLAGGAARGR